MKHLWGQDLIPGSKWRRRDGCQAIFIIDLNSFELKAENNLVFYNSVLGILFTLNDNCKYYSGLTEHECDILDRWKEPTKIEGWVNVYATSPLACLNVFHPGFLLDDWKIHFSKSEADKVALLNKDKFKRIACIKVSGIEGEDECIE